MIKEKPDKHCFNKKIYKSRFFLYIGLFLISLPAHTRTLSAADEARNEFLKAGWSMDVANAVVTVNKNWFNILKKEHTYDFYQQINLLKKLNQSTIVISFLRQHPETAGLFALSDQPRTLVKILKKPACYHVLTRLFALHATHSAIHKLIEALEHHRDLICTLGQRGIFQSETVFIFPRNTKGAIEYDAWLERVFDKYLRHSDEQLSDIVMFITQNGQNIRKRLNHKPDFYQNFRKKLWPSLERVVYHHGTFAELAHLPEIWNILAHQGGEALLKKWGVSRPLHILLSKGHLQTFMIQTLLECDANTLEAFLNYQDEPLFRHLMQRRLSAATWAALSQQLLQICPNYPEQTCPTLPYHLRYFSSISHNTALAQEMGVLPDGAIAWIPFHSSYYAITKITEGRDLTGEDILNMGLDMLTLVPSFLFAKPFSGFAYPLKNGVVFNISTIGLSFTPYRYHLVKPFSKFVILTGRHTSKILIQESIKSSQKQPLNMTTVHQNVILSKIKYHIPYTIKLLKFETDVFMRQDETVVMLPSNGLSRHFFRETVIKALSAPNTPLKKTKISAWQQNISAWWLMNAAMPP